MFLLNTKWRNITIKVKTVNNKDYERKELGEREKLKVINLKSSGQPQ